MAVRVLLAAVLLLATVLTVQALVQPPDPRPLLIPCVRCWATTP